MTSGVPFDPNQLAESRKLGSAFAAPRFESYQVVDGVLRPVGTLVDVYFPILTPGLPLALSRLHEGDEAQVVQFAEAWGLMGYWPADGAWTIGDPLVWLWAHARGIRTVFELRDYLGRRDAEGLATFLRTLSGPPPGFDADKVNVPQLTFGTPHGVRTHACLTGDSPTNVAAALICAVVGANRGEATLDLEFIDGSFVERINLGAAIVAAYVHVADAVTKRRFVRCEAAGCGKIFPQTDRRQRFCPPPPEWTGKTGSICGARTRKQRQRKVGG